MINTIDLWLLYLLNRHLGTDLLDQVFIFISNPVFLLAILAVVVAVISLRRGHPPISAVAAVIVVLALADAIGSQVLKRLFCRPRPCHVLPDLRLVVDCGGRFGFPSNHALNSAAVVAYLSGLGRRLTQPLWILVALICVSRVYLGKHYPSDVVAGVAFGLAIGYAASVTVQKVIRHHARKQGDGR